MHAERGATRHAAARAHATLLAAVVAAAAMLSPLSLLAQGEVARTCDFRYLPAPDSVAESLRPMHPNVAYPAMAERMANDQWVLLVDSVRQSVQANVVIDSAERRVLLEQLRLTQAELASAQGTNGRATLANVTTARFKVSTPTAGDDENAYVLFLRTSPLELAPLRPGSRRAVCWTALAMGRLLTAYGAPSREAATRSLHESVMRWDNFGAKGYSMLPWELALNSHGYSPASFDPPRTQKIFLHPALGLELVGARVKSIGDLADLQSTDVVTLEPVGYLIYNTSRSFYVGASALVTLADERRVGVGAMIHLGQAIKAGYAWRARDAEGRRGQSFILSADLYQFLLDTPGRLKEWKSKALGQGVAALQLGTRPE